MTASRIDSILKERTHWHSYPDDQVLLCGRKSLITNLIDKTAMAFNPISFVDSLDASFGLVAITDPSGIDDLFDDLAKHTKILVPIADFTGGASPRADYVASSFNLDKLAEAISVTRPIRMHLRENPQIRNDGDYLGLTAIALAASRNGKIEARLNPLSRNMVDYPLLTGFPDPGGVLESLAGAKLLKRSFFERSQCCGHCGSARVIAREVCENCNSSHLSEDTLVHHYKCGHQGEKSSFLHDQHMTCPKCNVELRHFGVDYDTPGHLFVCNDCGASNAEPVVSFLCADCNEQTPGEDMREQDWHHYELTTAAKMALQEGRLPTISLDALTGNMSGRISTRDMALVLGTAHRIYRRYKRDYSLLFIQTRGTDNDGNEINGSKKIKLQRFVTELLNETIRETDYLTVMDDTLIVLLPETPHENSSVLVGRLNDRINQALGEDACAGADIIEYEKTDPIIEMLGKA